MIFEVTSELVRVDNVAVVGERKVSGIVMEEKWLHILDASSSGGRVTDVAYRHTPRQARYLGLVEDLRHKPFSLDSAQHSIIAAGDYPAAFLTAVLKRVQTVIYKIGGILDSINPEDAAFLVNLADI